MTNHEITLTLTTGEFKLVLSGLGEQIGDHDRLLARTLRADLMERVFFGEKAPTPEAKYDPVSRLATREVEPTSLLPPVYLGKGTPPRIAPEGDEAYVLKRKSPLVTEGPFANLRTWSHVKCGHCHQTARVIRAMRERWVGPTDCGCKVKDAARVGEPAEHTVEQPPEPLPPAIFEHGPFAGLRQFAKVTCTRCGRQARAIHAQGRDWRSPYDCGCSERAEPVPEPEVVKPPGSMVQGYIQAGRFAGERGMKKVCCSICKTERLLYQVREGKEDWPSIDRCRTCKNVWTCATCGATKNKNNRYEVKWPLPDMCAACAKAAEPETEPTSLPSIHEEAVPWVEAALKAAREVESFHGSDEVTEPNEPSIWASRGGILFGTSGGIAAPEVEKQEAPYIHHKGPNPFSKKKPVEIVKQNDRKGKQVVRQHLHGEQQLAILPEYVKDGPLKGLHRGMRLLCASCGARAKVGIAEKIGWTGSETCDICGKRGTNGQ